MPKSRALVSSLKMTTRAAIRRALVRLIRCGIDPVKALHLVTGTRWYRQQFREYEKQRCNSSTPQQFQARQRRYKIVSDRFDVAGDASGHYFHQDLWVAQRIFERKPKRHVDFGSRIDGFVAHVASFRDIEVGDIRPLNPQRNRISYFQIDLMRPGSDLIEITDSASCLHALEHFGLGRYGDNINYEGWRYGLDSLALALVSGGSLYLSVPISSLERIEFNAHRVFSVPTIHDAIHPNFEIIDFVYVDDSGDLRTDTDIEAPQYANSFGLTYGCGIWDLRRKTASL